MGWSISYFCNIWDIGTIDNIMVFFLLTAPYIDRSPIQKG